MFCCITCVVLFHRAGKPPVGLHLDVAKGDKLIQVGWPDGCLCWYLLCDLTLTYFTITNFNLPDLTLPSCSLSCSCNLPAPHLPPYLYFPSPHSCTPLLINSSPNLIYPPQSVPPIPVSSLLPTPRQSITSPDFDLSSQICPFPPGQFPSPHTPLDLSLPFLNLPKPSIYLPQSSEYSSSHPSHFPFLPTLANFSPPIHHTT